MKKEMSSIDLHYIVAELQELKGARVDKVYQPSKKEIIIQLRRTGGGKPLIRISPNFIYIARQKPEAPEAILGLCKALRKYLENTRLASAEQADSERVAILSFESKDAKYFLFAELFGGGNIILCDGNETIIQAAENKKMKGREVRGGIKYKAPSRGIALGKITAEQLKKIISSSTKGNLPTVLAVDLGLGGSYAKELCAMAGISESEKALKGEQIRMLHSSLKKMLEEKPNPQAVNEGLETADATPFRFKTYSEAKSRAFNSFSEAIESIMPPETHKKESKFEKDIIKLEKAIAQQEERIAELEGTAENMQKYGEKIYENYQLVKEILDEIKKARKKYSWAEIRERLKGHKIVREVNEKTGKITAELQ